MQGWGLAVLRIMTGGTFLAHGLSKLLPLWGGGPTVTAALFASIGLTPAYPLALLVGAVELGGGLVLVAGYRTVWVGGVLLLDMVVAVWRVHLASGFFLGTGADRALGYEFNVLLMAALACLMIEGAGALSVDARRERAAEAQALGRARLRSGSV